MILELRSWLTCFSSKKQTHRVSHTDFLLFLSVSRYTYFSRCTYFSRYTHFLCYTHFPCYTSSRHFIKSWDTPVTSSVLCDLRLLSLRCLRDLYCSSESRNFMTTFFSVFFQSLCFMHLTSCLVSVSFTKIQGKDAKPVISDTKIEVVEIEECASLALDDNKYR